MFDFVSCSCDVMIFIADMREMWTLIQKKALILEDICLIEAATDAVLWHEISVCLLPQNLSAPLLYHV